MGKSQATYPGFRWSEVLAGPNLGYVYVLDKPAQPVYRWVVSQPVLDSASEFFRMQCGNFNATTNPGGITDPFVLRENAIRHESGEVESHYRLWKDALAVPSNNPGQRLEPFVRKTSASNFATEINLVLREIAEELDARGGLNDLPGRTEPCNSELINHDATCQYRGPVNPFPYPVACP